MRKLFVLFVLVLVGFPTLTEAQSRTGTGGWYGRGGYNNRYPARQSRYGYDPYYDQLVRLPGNLVACQMDFDNAGKVVGCHPLTKTVEFLEEHAYAHQNRNELVGTTHVHEGKLHFRPYDDTNRRLGTSGGAVFGGVAGAAGGGAVAGEKGALGGAAVGAVIGAIVGSHGAHDNCLEVGNGSQAQPAAETKEVSPVSNVGQATQPVTDQAVSSNKGPAYRSGNRAVVNSTRVPVEIYDGSVAPENLVGEMAPGEEWSLAKPKTRYRVFAQIPNNEGGITADELTLAPNTSGWTFVQPEFNLSAKGE